MTETVTIEDCGGWSRVTLNRPERLNALNEPTLERLLAILHRLAEDEGCRAVLLTGAGRGFCAGQDLADCVPQDGRPGLDLAGIMERCYNPLVRLIRTMPKPVVCAVNGVAAGGGANLALAGDIVVAARSATFVQAFAKIGLIPDVGGTYFLPRLVGDARARALSFLAEPVGAEQAAAWGMIWRAVDDDRLAAETVALVERLASQPTQAFALMKRAFAQSATNTLDAQLEVERSLQGAAGATPDHAEGLAAFFAKRAPNFTGRAASSPAA
ncbi:enoyl-CoA hydratase-related protein [Methylobacterium frigidaeris]|uniref:1,2-epoxyphenylacetyl-CoA isomerase n=1 Tax=Methylobacterium frigidaeris TaxID=2038277 RepID=A0AA37HHM0_9HYPH|nr:enoyl-CoA hydratase-related protein [Methylobacterium frigidaeris]PIK72849.1 2-(1,2-epoxy-1,2-dihydrophenyl)acetyl-CoA isomerase [Methylobacterium frigidaeris]GJD66046.1 1,2-epoxyphenylacetyl-CoA isomerase [Methylobacterium frigidaeris]